MKTLFVTLSLILSTALPAYASTYFRFWQGAARENLSNQQFLDGLNQVLLPATGRLKHTAALLKSYQPVVISPTLAQRFGLPSEVALLSYDNEDSYRRYRETPEGKAYGDLHWEMFEKSLSGSTVPTDDAFVISVGSSYIWSGRHADWSEGAAYFQILARSPGMEEARYIPAIRNYMESLSAAGARSLIFVVNKDSVLIYSLWENSEFKRRGAVQAAAPGLGLPLSVLMDVPLTMSRELDFGKGIRYRLD